MAFLPPVSGGTAACPPDPLEIAENGHYFALTRQPDRYARRHRRACSTGAEGAVVTFEGTVRNNTKGRPRAVPGLRMLRADGAQD